ncbi:MAG: extracellular solute-binding protein [Candidatus Eisenbacteria bacterium]
MKLVLTTAIVLLVLAGCGGGGAGKGTGGRQVVVFWQFFPSEQVEPVLAEFMKQNPDVEVRMEQLTWQSGLEKITAAVAAGNVPDLCELGSTWFPRFAHQGALADWSDSAATLAFDGRAAEMATLRGRMYGVPWLVGTRVLFWNKELFARAGVDTSRAPATWVELNEACRKVHALGGGVAGYGANSGERYVLFKKFMPYAWGNGGSVLDAGMTTSLFDSPANVGGLEQYLRLAKTVGRYDRQEQIDDAFIAGRIGATISGSWILRKAPKQAPGLRYGVALVPMPAADHAGAASFLGGELLVSFRRSANPSGAWRLARFLASKEAALAVARANQAVQPAASGAIDDPFYAGDPHQRVLLEQLRTAVPTPNHPAWLEMESAIEDEVEKALYGKVSAAQAIHAASERIDALLKATPPADSAGAAGR